MAKGICVNCGKHVGGMMGPKGFKCPSCGKCYCKECGPQMGLIFKKPTCPTCGVQLYK